MVRQASPSRRHPGAERADKRCASAMLESESHGASHVRHSSGAASQNPYGNIRKVFRHSVRVITQTAQDVASATMLETYTTFM